MLFQIILLWVLFLVFLIPIVLFGILLLRKTLIITKAEILFPLGAITGLTIFVFLINALSFFIQGIVAVIAIYSLFFLFSLLLYFRKDGKAIDYPKGRSLVLYLISTIGWGIFIWWKCSYALIGSDTNLYYAIAHTFIKGNFPPFTPWQVDLPLSYHLGASQLLGVFYALTNIKFEFLHVIFSFIFIFLSTQIVIWLGKRHTSFFSFFFANIGAIILFVSLGFFKFVFPIFPLNFQIIDNIHNLFLWIRSLPTVDQSVEVYGAAFSLDSLIYFIHTSFGLAVTFSVISIIYINKKSSFLTWVIILLMNCSLALINESLFVILTPVSVFILVLREIENKKLLVNYKILFLLLLSTLVILFFQGGFIKEYIFPSKNLEKSIILNPSKEDIKGDFAKYHLNQEISKVLEIRKEWSPFIWHHIGLDFLIIISLICISLIKFENQRSKLVLAFFLLGLTSLIAYNLVVPKFLIANGNRFLAFSYLFFSYLIILSFSELILRIKKNIYIKLLISFLAIFIIIPTILPPLFLLSKTRFGPNRLIPKGEEQGVGIKWLEKNISYDKKIVVLDARSPHPSGQARVMVQAGIFAPVFIGNYKAYTIEASPEYLDISYYLSPSALNILKIDLLLVDSKYHESLLDIRKQQLLNDRFFERIFETYNSDGSWEKIFKVKNDYLQHGKEIPGTLYDLVNNTDIYGKIYIDSEKNFNPSLIRRAIIFTLRDKELYFLPESGVYLNVEQDINFNNPNKNLRYNFLVLAKNTDPKNICNCKVERIWDGLKGEIFLWKVLSY